MKLNCVGVQQAHACAPGILHRGMPPTCLGRRRQGVSVHVASDVTQATVPPGVSHNFGLLQGLGSTLKEGRPAKHLSGRLAAAFQMSWGLHWI